MNGRTLLLLVPLHILFAFLGALGALEVWSRL